MDKKVIIKKARKKKLNHARNYIKVKYVQFKDSVFIKSKFKPLSELDKTIFDKTKVKDVEIEEVCKTGILKVKINNLFQLKYIKFLINYRNIIINSKEFKLKVLGN